jgi:outer membrane receptor protein involved in Fe transport
MVKLYELLRRSGRPRGLNGHRAAGGRGRSRRDAVLLVGTALQILVSPLISHVSRGLTGFGCRHLRATGVLEGQVAGVRDSRSHPAAISTARRGPSPGMATPERPDANRAADGGTSPRVSIDVRGVRLEAVLREIARQAGVSLVYSGSVVPLAAVVSLRVDRVTPRAAFEAVLRGTGVAARQISRDQVVLVRAPRVETDGAPSRPAVADSGVVAGRVTDTTTGLAVAGATVSLGGPSNRKAVVTAEDGRFRFGGLPPGSYEVRVRRLGYSPVTRSVSVAEGQQAITDIALTATPGALGRVVVTGTVIATELKSVPNPVSVITSEDIERQRISRVDQILRRGVVPGGVAWELGTTDYINSMTVRGTNSLLGAGSTNAVKIYVDGVEVADNLFSAIDVTSIDRIELIRGPQGSTVYGSDASGGVLQVFTKKGSTALARPQLEAMASVTEVESRYHTGRAPQQDHSLAVRGGTEAFGYSFGGSYARGGGWVPEYRTETPSLYGGARIAQGAFTLDVSTRYHSRIVMPARNPVLVAAGYAPFRTPLYLENEYRNRTFGIRMQYAPVPWWEQQLTLGFDQTHSSTHNTQARRRTATDTLVMVNESGNEKGSVAYNTSLRGSLGREVSATLTLGADHYTDMYSGYSTTGAYRSFGFVRFDPRFPPSLSRGRWTNTGYFAQGQVGLWNSLFLTAGYRTDANQNVGRDYGTARSPRVGLAYARGLGRATVKLRGAYGESTKPPAAGAATLDIPGFRPNAELAPERQRGSDFGIDLDFGGRASVGATYYDQVGDDLIGLVVVDATAVPRVSQYQNVGRVSNRGVELDASLRLSHLDIRGQFTTMRSKLGALAAGYTGELKVGDGLPGVPRRSAGINFSYDLFRRTAVTAGVTRIGPWTNVDWLAFYADIYGGGRYRGSQRAYWMQYPSVTKLSLGAEQGIGSRLNAFVAIDNATNNEAAELDNQTILPGRKTTLGVRVRY